MIEQLTRWVIRWRYLVIAATLIFIGVTGSGVRFLSFTTDYRIFFSEENPQLQAFEEIQNTYSKSDNVLFVLEPSDGQVFTQKTLDAVEWLTHEAWQIPYSNRVDSISNFQHTYAEEDDLIVEDLISDANHLSLKEISRIKAIALQEPFLLNRMISPQAHVTGINVTVQLPGKNVRQEVPEAANFAKELAKKAMARYPHLKIHLTGIVMINNTFPEASRADMQTLIPVMFVAIIVLLGLLLRGFSGAFACLLLLLFSIISTMGIAGWMGIILSPPPAIAPVVILTIAIADGIHILVTMLHEMRISGRAKWDAIITSLRVNFQPIALTSVTTAIGFLSLNFGEVPPFHDLGNIVAIGVGIAFMLSIIFLPAILAILPIQPKVQENSKTQIMMNQLAEFVIGRRHGLMWGLVGVIVLLIAFIPRNEFNDVFEEYFDETFEFRQAADFANENLTGLTYIDYSLSAGQADGIYAPAFLRTVAEFAEWCRQQPEIVYVNTITDTFKRLNKNMHGDDPNYYHLPQQRDLAAQYLLLYEMSLPYGLDVNNQINIDKSAIKLTVIAKRTSTREILALEERIQQWLQQNGLPSMQQTVGASTSIMFSHITSRNIRAMIFGAIIALVLISFILIFALRSLKYGLISLIPNLMPAAMAFGVWGIFVAEIGLGLSMVASMTLGIVVDDTIHFLSNYLRAHREQKLSAAESVRYAFENVGVAMWFSTVVLVVGFFILSFSHFQINAGMGLATAITIALALVADFLLLPPILMKLEDKECA
jgi:uncharacterized protein